MSNKRFDKSTPHRPALPRTELSQQYDHCLTTVKTQIDMIVTGNNSVHAWLNEVQAYLNRARCTAADTPHNMEREYYDE